jgi:hypothetical protein
MSHIIKAKDIAWVARSARRFSKWLVHEASGHTWTRESLKLPGIYRWTVSWICYEGLFEWLWSEQWFQDGMRAFGLIALEREGKIAILQSEEDGMIFVRCSDGTTKDITTFLNGESLAIRHDLDFADLSWDPVSSMSHLLSEYDDSSS